MCISRKFSQGGTSFRQEVVPKFLPLQQPIFWKIEGGDWTPYPPSRSADATIQGKLLYYSIMVEISKLSWESGGKIRSSKLHTNSVRACISLARKQLSLEKELSRGNVCMATVKCGCIGFTINCGC